MTSCSTSVETWSLPRESKEWVGPILVTKTDAGTGEPVSDPVKFAVLPNGTRPTSGDWADPVEDPDGGTAVGVAAGPVSSPGFYGIWAKVVGTSEQPVLEPAEVGYINRT